MLIFFKSRCSRDIKVNQINKGSQNKQYLDSDCISHLVYNQQTVANKVNQKEEKYELEPFLHAGLASSASGLASSTGKLASFVGRLAPSSQQTSFMGVQTGFIRVLMQTVRWRMRPVRWRLKPVPQADNAPSVGLCFLFWPFLIEFKFLTRENNTIVMCIKSLFCQRYIVKQ